MSKTKKKIKAKHYPGTSHEKSRKKNCELGRKEEKRVGKKAQAGEEE